MMPHCLCADVDFTADLTILEEGTELLNRLVKWKNGETEGPPIPMFTSCCPGWIGELAEDEEMLFERERERERQRERQRDRETERERDRERDRERERERGGRGEHTQRDT